MSDKECIARVKAHIDANYSGQVTIARLARLACMSASKLKYSFKAAVGLTVHSYLTEVRMGRAEQLLADTKLPVARVAEMVGYKKAGAFAAAFKKRKGRLPKDTRKKIA
ncbi:MAG: AraC family transcriptional regulator [Clostridiales Family XIII bacterium]|nr:AraC family transcriptional regulator [Clostridiales Family XIII bacterium]